MPALFPSGSNALATLRSLATRGDDVAEALMAIMNGTYWPSLTAAAEASEVIRVSGQVKDQDGSSVAGVKAVLLKARLSITSSKSAVALATAAALPACTPAGTGVGHTLTADANGVLTIDGVDVELGDRVLVKNQVAGDDNGIYTCTTAGTSGAAFVLTRATDFDAAGEMTKCSILVRCGKQNGGRTFIHTTTAAITVDTTALVFTAEDTLVSLGLGAAGATVKSGAGTLELWLETSSTGAFSVDVTSVAAWLGDVLLEVTTDNGEVELLKLTFA